MKSVFSYSSINLTVLDQVLVSGVNLVLNIFLARMLGVEGFGIFSVLWVCVLFVSSLQLALILYPILSLTIQQEDQNTYLNAVFWLQVIFTIASGIALFILCFYSGDSFFNVKLSMYAFDISLLAMLHTFQDFLRRLFFVLNFHRIAIFSDLISYLGRLILLSTFFRFWPVDVATTLKLIAFSSFISIAFTIKYCGVKQVKFRYLLDTFTYNWSFSRWLLGSSLLQWLTGNFFVLVASSTIGPFAAGVVRISQNLMGATHVVFLSMENYVPRRASECYKVGGIDQLILYFRKIAAYILVFVSIVILAVAAFPRFWIGMFYGDSYIEYAFFLRWYVLLYLFMAINITIKLFLRTVGETRAIFISDVLAALISVMIARPLIVAFQFNGVLIGTAVSMAVVMVSLIIGSSLAINKEKS